MKMAILGHFLLYKKISVEYSTAVEYSDGSQIFFLNQKYVFLQILVYGMWIRLLVIELWKKRLTLPQKRPFLGGGRRFFHSSITKSRIHIP